MYKLALRLLPDNHDSQELNLQSHCLDSSLLDAVNNSSAYVFCDYNYRAQLLHENEQINDLIVLINGNSVDINYSKDTGYITFNDITFGARIFLECYGFVQISLIYNDDLGIQHIKETEYIQVMVRKGRQNDSVKRMTEYVYAENSELLYGKNLPKEASGLQDFSNKTLESRILLLERIAVIYESNFRYYKTNSRFRTVECEKVDSFEKLQYISPNTLQYISTHPEELKNVHNSKAIQINKSYYQPNRTLITGNKKSLDIYENRVIVSFLQFLLKEISRIESEVCAVIHQTTRKSYETEQYITSSIFIYVNIISNLKIVLQDLQRLRSKYEHLLNAYKTILPVQIIQISVIPKISPLFKAIPQYYQIYNCIIEWFSKGVFALHEERFMLSFLKMSSLYEVYILAKQINFFKSSGYELVIAKKKNYPFSTQSFYENTQCNNYFQFSNGKNKVTLYYQPVIYNSNMISISGIGLYRNTSISFPKSELGSKSGTYYTPDYLIKYEYEGKPGANYLLADAKFSRLKTVQSRQVAEVAYKYIFSISPLSNEDKIVGLCIFNGQSDFISDTITNIYDYEQSQIISPLAEIITMTENETNNGLLHEALFKNSIGLHITYIPQKIIPLPKNKNIEIEPLIKNASQSTFNNRNMGENQGLEL